MREHPCPAIDPHAIEQLIGLSGEGDTALLEEIIDVFAVSGPDTLARIRETLAAGRHQDACRHAHTLAGSALTLGATDVVTLARRIEHGARDGQDHDLASVVDEIDVLFAPTIEALRDVSASCRDRRP